MSFVICPSSPDDDDHRLSVTSGVDDVLDDREAESDVAVAVVMDAVVMVILDVLLKS